MEEVEITKTSNGLITVYYNGIEINFARENGRIVEKSRRSFTGKRAYFSPPDYAKVIEAACNYWGLPYSPKLFTLVGIKKRKTEKKKALLVKGAQVRLPL